MSSYTLKSILSLAVATALVASTGLSIGWAQEVVPVPGSSEAVSALQLGSSARKVPAGTFLRIGFNNAMDARITEPGEPFTAQLTDDFLYNDSGISRIILPAGTVVRGRISDVKRPGFFSKGGAIHLNFDHVVLPSGEMLPLDLTISPKNEDVNKAGALYMDPGIKKKVEKGVEEGKDTFNRILDLGVQTGKDTADGLGSIVTVPLAVAGGALAAGAVTTGKAAIAVVGKGDTVVIQPGDTIVVDFSGSFNMPAE